MTITIQRTYMLHTSGTKFYQPFLISYKGGDLESSATVVHFGPASSKGSGSDGRPLLGGQVQLTAGREHYQRQIEAKARKTPKGYYEIHAPARGNSYSPEEGRKELIRLFGASKVESILLELGLTYAGDEADPTTPVETVVSEPKAPTPAPKPANWGTW